MKEIYDKYKVFDENNVKGFFEEFRFLSNFHVCDVLFEGILYPSSENAYMAAKSLDENIRRKFSKYPPESIQNPSLFPFPQIAPALSPAAARKLGRHGIELRPDWESVKYDSMLAIVFDKFWRNHDIRKFLLDTGEKYLEETNHWKDEYWGANAWTGAGENNLGKILMKVRECLKK